MEDLRRDTARFYDAHCGLTDDIGFYEAMLEPDGSTHLLELGCGTGRVLTQLAGGCASVVGVDSSAQMLGFCEEKLRSAPHLQERVQLVQGDICRLALDREFDLIIAPFRVFQNIAADADIAALFDVIHRHLRVGGSCVLNTFCPNSPAADLVAEWRGADPLEEVFTSERPYREGVVCNSFCKTRFTERPLVLYPELRYRYYVDGAMVDSAAFTPPMRVYYPDELLDTIVTQGFAIQDTWGGYTGQRYGEGPELVVRFGAR